MRHSHRISAVKDYARHIAAVIAEYPGIVTFNPKPRSVDTFASRFRDACNAQLLYNYPVDEINTARLREIWDETEVSMQGEFVVVGSRAAIKASKASPQGGVSVRNTTSEAGVEVLFEGAERAIEILCNMISSGNFPSKPVFVVSGLEEKQIQYLESIYNVGIVPHESQPGKFKIL
jgi:hypothetical protein